MHGDDLEFIRSYFSERKLSTKVSNSISAPGSINLSVPQGSILGPLLFNVFINDLTSLQDCETVLFADDATLIISGVSFDEISQCAYRVLANLRAWCLQNQMDINLKKTKSMCFNLNAINLIYDNVLIEHITQFMLLGMLIDSKLSFRNNCDIIDRKPTSYFLFFIKLDTFSPKTLN